MIGNIIKHYLSIISIITKGYELLNSCITDHYKQNWVVYWDFFNIFGFCAIRAKTNISKLKMSAMGRSQSTKLNLYVRGDRLTVKI